MPPPTNIDQASATDLGSLPISTVQQVDDAGTTYTVWYKYTAVAGDNVINLFAFGDLVNYIPTPRIQDSLANILIAGNTNRPVQLAVTPGETYYLIVTPNIGNPTPAILNITGEGHVDVDVPIGSIGINDDTPGFPLALLPSTQDNTVLKFIQDIVAGEGGATLPNGSILLQDTSVAGQFYIYDKNYTAYGPFNSGIGDVDYVTPSPDGLGWYICASGAPTRVRFVDLDGNLGPTTWGNLNNNSGGIAVSPDQTILYFVNSTIIRRWDLVNNLALSDLVSVGAVLLTDILCLSDGSIIVAVPAGDTVRHYSAAGALINSFTGFDNIRSTPFKDRLTYALTDDSIWMWQHGYDGSGTLQRFLEIRVSDGVILTTVTGPSYEVGAYTQAATETPVPFGNSQSCPFWITRALAEPTGDGTIIVQKVTNPSSDTTRFTFTATGMDPVSFELAHGESRTFTGLPAGTYSVVEETQAGYITTYGVSNGDPNTAITVTAGETVTVTVTNTVFVPGGIYKIQPGKRNDTLWTDVEANETVDVKIPNPSAKTAFFGG